MTFLYLVSLFLFLFYVGRLSARIARRSLTEWLLTTFLLGAGSVILTGFILSALHLTANSLVWALSVFVTATVLGTGLIRLTALFNTGNVAASESDPFTHRHFSILLLIRDRSHTFIQWFGGGSAYSKFLFSTLFVTLAVIAVTNLLLVLFTVPNEWDSMTGHLNRVMQYVQRGTMQHFGGTNWNMDTYPKSVCTLQIYAFLMTGRFENGFKFIHHLSYWISIVAVFGIVQRIGQLSRGQASLSASFFCALTYALLPDFLMQAITTETDIVLTAYLSVLLYMLFSYKQTVPTGTPERDRASSGPADVRYLWLAGMAFGMAFGHKITFALLLPSVFVVMIYTVFQSESVAVSFGRTWRLGAAIVISVCLWTLPTGYLKNIEVFGHPIGPPTALKHQSVERAGSLRNLLEQGSRNVIRYGYEHVNLEGIRNLEPGAAINRIMRKPLVVLENKLHLRLDEETSFSIETFTFERKFMFYNANPYWGVFGFGLIFPLLLVVLTGIVRSKLHLYVGLALVLHFAALSWSAPYDPFKGRYFMETGLFGILFLSLLFLHPRTMVDIPGRRFWKGYVGLVTVLGCVSAVLCVYLNIRALPFGWTAPDGKRYPSAFASDRIRQMVVGRLDMYIPYKRFDELVPDTATVALGTINDDYEYPLYGPKLARRLIAVNPFEQGLKPIPPEADYLFFDKSVIQPKPGDIRLGTDTTMRSAMIVPAEDYYLRKLK